MWFFLTDDLSSLGIKREVPYSSNSAPPSPLPLKAFRKRGGKYRRSLTSNRPMHTQTHWTTCSTSCKSVKVIHPHLKMTLQHAGICLPPNPHKHAPSEATSLILLKNRSKIVLFTCVF